MSVIQKIKEFFKNIFSPTKTLPEATKQVNTVNDEIGILCKARAFRLRLLREWGLPPRKARRKGAKAQTAKPARGQVRPFHTLCRVIRPFRARRSTRSI